MSPRFIDGAVDHLRDSIRVADEGRRRRVAGQGGTTAPDRSPPDMGPDLGPCNGQPTCCGDGIVQASEHCEPGLPIGNPDRCPFNPSDCDQSGPIDMCIEGNNCLRRCVPKDGLNPTLICP